MLEIAHINPSRMSDPAYRSWCKQWGALYAINALYDTVFFIDRKTEPSNLQKLLFCQPKFIILNELFDSEGNLHKYKLPGSLNDIIEQCKSRSPKSRIWIADCKPRCLKKWEGIRRVCRHYPIDGLGVQVHFDIGRGVVPEFLTAQAVFQFVKYQTHQNRAAGFGTAFSEVSVLPGRPENIPKIGRIYTAIDRLAHTLEIDWLMWWSPEDSLSWHWDQTRKLPCGIFSEDLATDRRT